MIDYDEFGKSIRYYRQLHGYTIEQLAEKSGISWKFLSDIERGKTKLSAITIISLLNVLHISFDSCFDRDLKSKKELRDEEVLSLYLSCNFSQRNKELMLSIFKAINKRKLV